MSFHDKNTKVLFYSNKVYSTSTWAESRYDLIYFLCVNFAFPNGWSPFFDTHDGTDWLANPSSYVYSAI